jgi:hypothetical protein
MCAVIVAGMVEDRGKNRDVAWMERSVIQDRLTPDYAALHPGYHTTPELKQPRRERPSAEAVSVAVMRFAQETTECRVGFGWFSVAAADHPGVRLRVAARSLQPRPPGCSGQ